jgi:crotonobetainyl-CoA:carnitine CoA-transferase CaiB-like acyl-CoA transferase
MAQPLRDVRVLDLAGESGVFATRLLADLGAEVLRIEPPNGGRLRHLGPFLNGVEGVERSYYHLFHNANKRSVVLDLDTTQGLEDLRRLAETVDILVETEAPGGLARIGFGYEHISASNPGLVYVSITPFGQTGPWSSHTGTDLTAAAAGGLLYPSGSPDDPPMHGNADPSFKMAGLQAATGALVALQGRAASGRGAHIDISVQEATVMAMVQQLNPNLYSRERQVPRRVGLYGPLFECLDGRWVGVRVRPDRFKRFLDWAEREGVATSLNDESLPGLDLIALPVGRFEDMAERDHFVATRQFFSVHDPGLGLDLGFTRSPFDGFAGGVEVRPAPTLGEHTAAVVSALPATLAVQQTSGQANPDKPLAGLRVLDFTWVLAGPFGTRILANFGAEVIRVESHARADSTRSGVPRGANSLDAGYLFNDANVGKKSLTLDLTREEGRDLVRKLVAKVDVVTNNFRPGTLERLGLGYEALRAIKPDIIFVGLPGCGTEGPWSERGTLGGVLMAASGLNQISGFDGRPPYGIATAFPDFTSPYLLASTVLAAVHERDRTGQGQEVHINQLSATVGLLGVEWMRFAAEGSLPRNANHSPNFCPHGVYRALGADAWVAIAADGNAGWRGMCAVIGRDDLARDEGLSTLAGRKGRADELDALLNEWTSTRDKWAIAELLQQGGVAAAAVESVADLMDNDPQLRHRAHYQPIQQPSEPGFELVIDGEAIHFAGVPRVLERAPMMGEHNEYVLRELAGLTEGEFDALVLSRVIN